MALPDKKLALLSTYIPFGPARIALLVKYFGGADKVWKASSKQLRSTGLSKKLVDGFIKHRSNFDEKKFFQDLVILGVSFTTLGSNTYPVNLEGLSDAPATLYIRGQLKSNDINAVAIVGSRKATTYGKEVAQKFAMELANCGVTIVSGLAFGVDQVAHKSVLDVGGRCIAVLASGIDEITPRSNEWLGKDIIASQGAVISEYPPGTQTQRTFFPHRNRIISGLSKAVIVVEGAEKSGTLHTASHAAKQGKEVFAIPGQVTSPLSAAPHFLIKNGAKIAFSPKDVVEELDMQLKTDKELVTAVLPDSKEEEILLEKLTNEPLHLDELARILSSPIAQISKNLTVMELKGMVKNMGGGKYKKI